jgi:hypothetical protein
MAYHRRLIHIFCLIILIVAPALSQAVHTVAKPNETV